MPSSFPSSRKHARSDSNSSIENDGQTIQSIEQINQNQPKRRRRENERHNEKRGHRVDQADASKSLQGLALEKDVEDDDQPIRRGRLRKKDKQRAPSPTSPDRSTIRPRSTRTTVPPSTSTSTPNIIDLTTKYPTTLTPTDPLSPIITRINNYISTNNRRAAFILLSTTTRGTTWQSTASRSSILQMYNLTKLLGDGKAQCLEQARMINDARRREMELKAEIKELRRESLMLKGRGENNLMWDGTVEELTMR